MKAILHLCAALATLAMLAAGASHARAQTQAPRGAIDVIETLQALRSGPLDAFLDIPAEQAPEILDPVLAVRVDIRSARPSYAPGDVVLIAIDGQLNLGFPEENVDMRGVQVIPLVEDYGRVGDDKSCEAINQAKVITLPTLNGVFYKLCKRAKIVKKSRVLVDAYYVAGTSPPVRYNTSCYACVLDEPALMALHGMTGAAYDFLCPTRLQKAKCLSEPN